MTNPVTAVLNQPAPLWDWARRVSLAVVTMLGVYLLVRLGLAILSPSSLWSPVLVAAPPQSVSVPTGSYDFSYNPFEVGDDTSEEGVAPPPGTDAPETTLNLTLVGLRSGENGTAFIRTPDNQDKNYYIDDEIMPGVVLNGVFPNYVLIRVNGQTQRLTMDDARDQRQAGQASPPRAGLQTLRTADAQTLLSQARLSVAMDDNGNRIGVSIEPRTPALNLTSYGLQQGDIITRFAGQNLSSGLPDMSVLRRVANSGRPVDVDILRDGKPMTITIGN